MVKSVCFVFVLNCKVPVTGGLVEGKIGGRRFTLLVWV